MALKARLPFLAVLDHPDVNRAEISCIRSRPDTILEKYIPGYSISELL